MRNVIKIMNLLTALIFVYSCNSNNRKASTHLIKEAKVVVDTEKSDSVAIAQVEALPEFNNISKWFQKTNKDTAKRIAEIIDHEPDNKFKYYSVEVGVDGPLRFESLEYFYVDAKTLSVSHLNLETDSAMSLSEWRKSGKDEWLH